MFLEIFFNKIQKQAILKSFVKTTSSHCGSEGIREPVNFEHANTKKAKPLIILNLTNFSNLQKKALQMFNILLYQKFSITVIRRNLILKNRLLSRKTGTG